MWLLTRVVTVMSRFRVRNGLEEEVREAFLNLFRLVEKTTVGDDGPGLSGELRSRVLERGVRADEGTPGSGLGLAIVRDLVELYGGSVELEGSELGGLQARITLPGA